jgi:hypothetical protein
VGGVLHCQKALKKGVGSLPRTSANPTLPPPPPSRPPPSAYAAGEGERGGGYEGCSRAGGGG